MKAESIVRQLYGALPNQTDLFSDTFNIASLTRVGATVTAVTSSPHGLSSGAGVTVSGAKSPIDITSLTFISGIATAITASRHDLTEGWTGQKSSDTPQVEISGAVEADYNGSHELLTVPNRTTFTYSVATIPTSPATGTPVLLEQPSTGYNGRQVITVIDTTTFTYQITQTPDSPAQGSPIVHTQVRASGSVTIEQAIKAYTKKATDKLWAIAILGDVTVSKNRHIASDASETQSSGSVLSQRLQSPFSIFVFVPTSDQLSARAARDQMEDVRFYLLRSLLNFRFTENLSSKSYRVTYSGDGFFDYNGAFYIHQFLFESVTDIVLEDGVNPDEHVAFMDIPLAFLDEFGTTELSITTNLDDV